MIPKEIMRINQWSVSKSRKELKRPTHYRYGTEAAISAVEAIRTSKENKILAGFYVTANDPYILGDIDHVDSPDNPFEELPPKLSKFLQDHPTYSEISPSGKGIRFVVRFATVKEKELLTGNIFFSTETDEKKQCQINIGPPWMTITNHPTSFSVPRVATVTIDELNDLFALKFKVESIDTRQPKTSFEKLPSLEEITMAIGCIKLDKNPRVQRAYSEVFNAAYQHYDLWLKVLMALHDYATRAGKNIECLEVAVAWSKTDILSFAGEDDVLDKWRSFKDREEIITYKSIFKLMYRCTLIWPKPAKQTEAERNKNIPRRPLTTEYINFLALVQYYNIKLHRNQYNVAEIYVSGDTDIVGKYFLKFHDVDIHYGRFYGPFDKKTIIPALHMMMQDYNFSGIAHGRTKEFLKNFLATTRRSINLVRLYFDAQFSTLPKRYRENEDHYAESSFDELFSCLKLDYLTEDTEAEADLYYRYYKCWLMGMVRNLYHEGILQINNCILLLTGNEQIRKTSHFKFLLPSFMQDLVAFTPHGFDKVSDLRDLAKLSSENLVLIWDEIEQYLSAKTESAFKKTIDNNPQKIIDKYEVKARRIVPMAIYGATSNKREFRLSDTGSRRIFHIPVTWVNTDKMRNICWHRVVNELKGEVEEALKNNRFPWLLTEEELEYQNVLLGSIRSKTTPERVLNDIYRTEEVADLSKHRLTGVTNFKQDRTGRLVTTRQVQLIINSISSDARNISRPALEHALSRVCSRYTNTERNPVSLYRPKCSIRKGEAYQGNIRRWVMPPIRDEFKPFSNK